MNGMPYITGREARNAQNEHILVSNETVRRCVAWLIQHGYTVLGIEIGDRNPVVWVQMCSRCDALGGAMRRIRKEAGWSETVMAAPVQGCQVQWIERGH